MRNDSAYFPRTVTAIQAGINEGLHLGAQLYVAHHGEALADAGFGQARVGVPMERETVLLWLSSGKPITAVAIAQLWEHGRLDLDDPVVRHVPEFGQGGKEGVTIRHLLTHTGGLRMAEKCDLGKDWTEIISCVCATPLEPHWVPGQRAAYHPSSSWYVLGEIIRRVSKLPVEEYARREIFEPCGMPDAWLALPPEQFRRYGDRLGLMYHTEKGAPSPHRKWNTEADALVCRPGRNGRGPTRQLGRFYERLLQSRLGAGPGGAGLLQPETVRQFTNRQRVGLFDDTFQQVLDWGLGFAIDSKRYGREMVPYGYGRFASEEAFGHGGSQSSCAFADPRHHLVVAWTCNGTPGERRHQQRAHQLNTAIYEDLGLNL
jgi:CubicO group peptidase (beta-lactamase class C family)